MPSNPSGGQYRLVCDQLRTIGHPERLQILLALSGQRRTSQELQEITALPANTLLNHLHKMRLLQIIEQTRFHRVVQYGLAEGHISAVVAAVQRQLHGPPAQHTEETDENSHMER